MEKQYVLSEHEYLHLCNCLEHIDTTVQDVFSQIHEQTQQGASPVDDELKIISKKLNEIMKSLEWA